MSYIHNPFAELPSNEEDIESMQSAAGDVEFFFEDDSFSAAVKVLENVIYNSRGVYDILNESTNSDDNNFECMLFDLKKHYQSIKTETLKNIQGHEEWLQNAQDAKKEAADLRADYYASVL